MVKAVFLDRDGVINRTFVKDGKPYAPRTLSEFALLPRVEEAVRALKEAGFLLLVVTNQPDIGNGLTAAEEVEAMHQLLAKTLPIRKIYTCPHRQDEGCACRKPKPGLLFQGRDEFGIDMKKSFMVGDRYSDVQAAQAAGCAPVFIDNKYLETPDFDGSMRASNLWQASQLILGKTA